MKKKSGARIANYRSGDRAEQLGVVLMQLFCAVASVPRQEDWGIVDAVATLLRRDGPLLYAEDSFLVQFKSRTMRTVKYLDNRFKTLLQQELPLFIARVDLGNAEIKLYSVAAVLAHPNINDIKGVVLYLDPMSQRLEKDILHTSLGDPVLQWTAAQLVDQDYERKAYAVMKEWLELDRWNRRYRKMGMQMQIRWQTDEVPSQLSTCFLWNPQRGAAALAEVVPAVQMLAGLAISDESIADPVLRLIAWMRDQGIDPDPSGAMTLMTLMQAGRKQLDAALEENDEASVAVRFIVFKDSPNELAFWLQSLGREGPSGATKYDGSVDELRALGFEVDIDADSQRIVAIGLGSGWLKERRCVFVGASDGVSLLRRARE